MTSNIKDNYREYLKKGKQQVDYVKLQNAIKELSDLISTRKNDYNLHLANKLINPTTNSKTYCSILNAFYNGREIPLSLPY